MFRAAFVGWLIGKAVVGLLRGVVWVVRSATYLVGAAGGWVVGRRSSDLSRSFPPGRP